MNSSKKHSEGESFASRWSRRKHALDKGDQEQGDQDQEAQAQTEEISNSNKSLTVEAAIDEKDAAQIKAEKLASLNALTDEDMPDVNSLDESSDFSKFMSTNVSEGLRKIALHKLFHGESYNVRDGLDEYDGDYTYFEKLDPNTITSDMKHLMEVEAEKLKQLEAQALLEDEAEDEVENEVSDEITDEQVDEDEPAQLADDSQQNIASAEAEDENLVQINEDDSDIDETQTDEEALT